MTIDLRHIQKLIETAEKHNKRADKAEGAKDQLLTQLRKEFVVKSLEEAELLAAKWEKEELRLEKELQKAKQDFEEKYNDKLSDSPKTK